MSDTNPMTWLTDVNGVEIGVEVIDTPADRHLRLVVPDLGLDRKLDKDDAARHPRALTCQAALEFCCGWCAQAMFSS